jgi:hypothetical protein
MNDDEIRLRDQLAIAALPAVYEQSAANASLREIADIAYALADAMLAARAS